MFFQDSDVGSVDRFAIDRQYVEDGYVRTALTAWLVGELMGAVEFQVHPDCPALSSVRLRSDARRLMEILKHLTFHLVIRAPRLTVVQYRGYDLVKKLFEALTTSKGRDLLPHDVRELHDLCDSTLERRRVVCDFIAGMTDRYAVEFYGRLYGGDQTIFKPF
jgi:dGTPase